MLSILKIIAFFTTLVLLTGCKQKISIEGGGKLTGINTLSYTDVEFKSKSDTALVATFDGRIVELIRGKDKKQLIIDLNDEIYDMAYNFGDQVIYAATLRSGIVVIDETRREIVKKLPLSEKWSTYVFYSEKYHLLMARDQSGIPYIWDVSKGYSRLSLPDELSSMRPVSMNTKGHIYFDGENVVGIWDLPNNEVLPIIDLPGEITAIDGLGNILTTSYDIFRVYSPAVDSVIMEMKHPDWPIRVAERDTIFRAPVSLPLTAGAIYKGYVYTSGIDRSIRKWNFDRGELAGEWLDHSATVSAMELSLDNSQLVSVDLKGHAIFRDL